MNSPLQRKDGYGRSMLRGYKGKDAACGLGALKRRPYNGDHLGGFCGVK